MSNGSTFVSTHCWANNVCQFDLSLSLSNSFLYVKKSSGWFVYNVKDVRMADVCIICEKDN